MDRLWVRLSLTFGLIILVVGIFPSVIFVLTNTDDLTIGFRDYLVDDLNVTEYLELSEAELDTLSTNLAREFRQDEIDGIQNFILTATIFGLAAGIFVSRIVSKPLEKLVEGATAVSAHNLDHRVEIEGSREFVKLASAFNQMTVSLARSETLRQNLMADVAHELLTPLTVLDGNLRAMLDGVYEMNTEEVGYLHEQTHHLIHLVKDLRHLAQAEAGQLAFDWQSVDVASLVESVSATLTLAAEEKGIAIEHDLPTNLPTLRADPARLKQVLHNLLANGLHHTPNGGTITVRAMQADNELWLSVEDNGEGIPATDLPYLFDRFYRADAGAKRRDSGGSGLGLAIAQAIAVAHNGRIDAKSPGESLGSTFTVYLPL
ncbi:MAG: ATP-binding protein [Chloroflexota bacterium]